MWPVSLLVPRTPCSNSAPLARRDRSRYNAALAPVRSRDVTGMHDAVATAALGAAERGVGGFDEIEWRGKVGTGLARRAPDRDRHFIGFSPPYSMDAASTRARSRSATTLAPTLGVSGKRMTNSSPP